MFLNSQIAPDIRRGEATAWAPKVSRRIDPCDPLLGVAAQTPLPTPNGSKRAQDIGIGDDLLCEDGMPVRVEDVQDKAYTRSQLLQNRALVPIRFDPDDTGGATDDPAFLFAPDLPVHVATESDTDSDLALRAEVLGNGGSIRPVLPDEGVTYRTFSLAHPATLVIGNLRVRFGAQAAAVTDLVAHVALTWRQEDKRTFRPLR